MGRRTAHRGRRSGRRVEVNHYEHTSLALLLDAGVGLHEEGRYEESLQAAEQVRDGARKLDDVGLEVRAVNLEATALKMLGRKMDALARYSWILGIAHDRMHPSAIEDEQVLREVLAAYLSWVECALHLPEVEVQKLFEILDTGERLATTTGKSSWRAGFFQLRAVVLWQLGRWDEARAASEEGLALAQRDVTAPGPTLDAHRCFFARLLCEAGRLDDARMQYETVLSSATSSQYGCMVALLGLVPCDLAKDDISSVRRHTEDALRRAESLGENATFAALQLLIDIHLRRGDSDAAAAVSNRALDIANRLGGAMLLFHALQSAAVVAIAKGDRDGANAFVLQAEVHAELLDRARDRGAFASMLDVLRARVQEIETTQLPCTQGDHEMLTKVSAERLALELLLDEARQLYEGGRFAEALRTAEVAREAAKRCGDLALEVQAVGREANALAMLGCAADAFARNSWIVGVAREPLNRSLFADDALASFVSNAHLACVDAALRLPSVPVHELFKVLDAGESFVLARGKPTWRAGLLAMRARVLAERGSLAAALPLAEEAVVTSAQDPDAPGVSLGSQRTNLGNLLRRAGRFGDARRQYEIVLGDPDSSPRGRFEALRGLVNCSIAEGDAQRAADFAREALHLAEPMGQQAMSEALEELVAACLAQGDFGAARDAAARRLLLARDIGKADDLFFALHRSAAVALLEDQGVAATGFLNEAEEHAAAMDRARGGTHYADMIEKFRSILGAPKPE